MKKILIVDDEPIIVELFAEYLSETYEVDICTNSLKVNSMISENKYDLVISDYNMPGLDGMALCEIVRKTSDAKFILISGYDDIDELADNGLDAILKKPIHCKTLKNLIFTLIGE